MSRERYYLEDRVKNHWRNPEWEKLAGKENRYSRQHPQEAYTQLPLVENVDNSIEVFPMSTGQPMVATMVDSVSANGIPEKAEVPPLGY